MKIMDSNSEKSFKIYNAASFNFFCNFDLTDMLHVKRSKSLRITSQQLNFNWCYIFYF